jgi:hypothetical protein
VEVVAPALLFYRQASVHRFEVDDPAGCDLVCAYIEFGAGMGPQILRGLPQLLLVPMEDIAGVQPTLDLLFAEAFAVRAGRSAAIDRLVEYFTILLLRDTVEASLVKDGVLAGLADERLAKAIMAVHAQPEAAWTLETLAGVAAAHTSKVDVIFVKLFRRDWLTIGAKRCCCSASKFDVGCTGQSNMDSICATNHQKHLARRYFMPEGSEFMANRALTPFLLAK